MTAADLAQALGGHRTGGQFLAKCPCHLDRSPSLAIREGQLGPLLFCHAGCSTRDVIDELRSRGLWDTPSRAAKTYRRPEVVTKSDDALARRRIGFVRHIWRKSYDPRGTLAERYLNSRELELDEDLALRVLRFHPACWWSKGEKLPCLVAAFEPITSSRTRTRYAASHPSHRAHCRWHEDRQEDARPGRRLPPSSSTPT